MITSSLTRFDSDATDQWRTMPGHSTFLRELPVDRLGADLKVEMPDELC